MLKECLKASQGVTLIPQITVRGEIDRGELSILPWEDEYMETAVLMIWHKAKWLSPSLKAFIDISRTIIGTEQDSMVGCAQNRTR
jgi:DNA-binding transcriptional LysR family regulator